MTTIMEPATGLEPAQTVYETVALRLSYTGYVVRFLSGGVLSTPAANCAASSAGANPVR